MATGAYLPAPTSTSSDLPVILAPALAYTWDNIGTLVADTPLPNSSASTNPLLGPVGSPVGGSTFTMWQPAHVFVFRDGTVTYPGVYVFVSQFTAWSPDGAYLDEYVDIYGLLGGVQNVPLATREQMNPPLVPIPVRDKGLSQVLSQISAGSNRSEYYLGWSHNGRLLAAETVNVGADGNPNPNAVTVQILDCATGKQVATFHPNPINTPDNLSPTLIRWSPDDTHLMVYDGALGELVLYDTHQISHRA